MPEAERGQDDKRADRQRHQGHRHTDGEQIARQQRDDQDLAAQFRHQTDNRRKRL